MNARIRASDPAAQLADRLAAQRLAFAAQPSPSAQERRPYLQALKRELLRHQDQLAAAIARDFGRLAFAGSLGRPLRP